MAETTRERDIEEAREWFLAKHKRKTSHILTHNLKRSCLICEGLVDSNWSIEEVAEYTSSRWEQALEAAAQLAENAIIPEGFRKTGMYTDFEEGGDEVLKDIAAAIRALRAPEGTKS